MGQDRLPERAAALKRLHQDARRPGNAGEPGEVAQPDPGPGLVICGPALDARDRQAGGVLLHAEQVGPAQNNGRAADLAVAAEPEPPGLSRLGRTDPGACRSPIDLEVARAGAD